MTRAETLDALEEIDLPVKYAEPEPRKWVYFIQQGRTGPVKIGCSRAPMRRLRQLQTASAEKLVMLGTCPGRPMDEAKIHDMFRHLRERGEWFKPDPLLLHFIQEVTTP
jgi:hypothetical protein